MIFGGDGIADESFADAFSDISVMDGITVTKPGAGEDSALGAMFDMFYSGAAAAAGYEGGIYTREVFDAVAIIGLAQATALRTPVDDGVKDMLGLAVAGPSAPQAGAAGTHAFDANGDVAGNGFDVCTFWLHDHDGEMHAELECHSSWGLFEGLVNDGIPMADEGDECPFDDEEWCETNMEVCVGENPNGSACGEAFSAQCDEAGNEDNEECAETKAWCEAGSSEDEPWDEWETAFCGAITAEEEVVEEEEEVVEEEEETTTNETVTEDEIEEAADEVPGFGLISAVAAIGAVLLLRRRL